MPGHSLSFLSALDRLVRPSVEHQIEEENRVVKDEDGVGGKDITDLPNKAALQGPNCANDTMLNSTFLFMDECTSAELDLAALTGVLVPVSLYPAIRDDLCAVVKTVLGAHDHIPLPVELHGRELLIGMADLPEEEVNELRLHVLSSVVDIINRYELQVIRSAYGNWREIKDFMKFDPNLYGLNFLNLLFWIQDVLKDEIVIPVMDGIPGWKPGNRAQTVDPHLIRAFAQSVHNMHHYRQYPAVAANISVEHYEHLAEPLFADSQYSTLIQLVDLVSYLLHQLEREECLNQQPRSAFRNAVLDTARRFDQELVHRSLQKLSIQH